MIHFFCAFMAEAQPIKDHFRIHQKQSDALFQSFTDKHSQYTLTITGAGRLNAAAAAAFAHSHFRIKKSDICLNVGIAGHEKLEPGTAVLIDKITQSDDQCWYPQIVFSNKLTRANCKTLEAPSSNYENMIFDMELSGLYEIWMRFGISELCHSIKIVSDNKEHDVWQFDIRQSTELIAMNISAIDTVLAELIPLQEEYIKSLQAPKEFQQCLVAHHFTQSQQVQLKNLLYRWQSFKPDTSIQTLLTQCRNSKDLLIRMQLELDNSIGIET